MNRLMAEHCGQTQEKIREDTERDRFLNAEAAVEYGIVDRIVKTRTEETDVASSAKDKLAEPPSGNSES